MSTDWSAFADRGYILPTDVAVYYDGVGSAGVNTPAHIFGAAPASGFGASLIGVATTASGHGVHGYNPVNASGGAGLWRIDYTAAFLHLFYFGASVVGSISSNGSATAFNTTSDYRLKHGFRPIEGAAAKLMKLKPGTFEWIATGQTTDGFLAHEFGDAIPGACHGEKDAVDKAGKIIPQGIDQSKAVPLLVAALQDALARIEALEARLA